MNERVGFELRHQLPSTLVLASLRGPLQAGGGYGWFTLDAANFSLGEVESSVAAVLQWLDHQSGYTSVGVLGFSQGSAIAVQCLRSRPRLFSCAALLSGFLSPFPAPGDDELAQIRPPVFSGRGDADPLVPQLMTTLTDRWLLASNLDRRIYPGLGHNVAPDEIADLAAFLQKHLH